MNTATMADITDVDVAEPLTASPPAIRQQTSLAQQRGAALAITPVDLLRMAVESGADMERLDKMMALYERWELKQAKRSYDDAFADFKAEAVTVMKGRKRSDGPLRGTSYAELHDVVDAVTPALSRNRLSSSWKLTKDERDWIEVTCYLRHADGHEESVSMGGPPDTGPAKNAVQSRSSTVTYLERQTLKAICGVAEGGEDDDGAGGRSQQRDTPSASNSNKTVAAEKPMYSQESFDKNKASWREIVKSKRKTPAQMIAFIETKGALLTESQRLTIDSWSREDD